MRNKKIISLVPRSEILRKSEIKIWVKIRIIQIHRTHVKLMFKSKAQAFLIFVAFNFLFIVIYFSVKPSDEVAFITEFDFT